MILERPTVVLHHSQLGTSFTGVVHLISTPETPIHQFRGIKYASIPARFRQSTLCSSYPALTDATKYGPICPQLKGTSVEEELFGLEDSDIPRQVFKQNEFECLNLNITCPGHLTPESHLPVMLWVHGGGNRGTGSSWVYDAGALVRKSVKLGKPIIVVSINYRLGLFGCAAAPIIREDNKVAGDAGVGNYGLRDQRKALEWVQHFIDEFGGDPANITLFGQGSGASDIIYHLHSAANQTRPLFQRAIVQSALIEYNVPDVGSAGWHLSRVMSQLHLPTLAQLRAVDASTLLTFGNSLHATDDGVFFRPGWRNSVFPPEHPIDHSGYTRLHPHKHRTRRSRSRSIFTARTPQHQPQHQRHEPPSSSQPLIIGDCSFDSFLWSLPASLWSSTQVMRRLKAVCGSLSKASALLRAYDISTYTPPDELVERILELINDARIAWPTQVLVEGAQKNREGKGVWRFTFDQEAPRRGIPHHATDLMYLFDNVPLPDVPQPVVLSSEESDYFGDESDYFGGEESDYSDEDWAIPVVDEFSYGRVRDAIQERWIAFAYGEVPWNEEKVFVFGPEGETGERSSCIFEGRRRKQVWEEALEPLGMQLVQKVGVELSNGPPSNGS